MVLGSRSPSDLMERHSVLGVSFGILIYSLFFLVFLNISCYNDTILKEVVFFYGKSL